MTYQFTPSTATGEQVEAICDLRAGGSSYFAIARALSISEDTVQTLCARNGFLPVPSKNAKSAGRKEEYSEGSVRGMTIAHLRDILREHGYWKVWETYDIPPETAKPMRCYPSSSLSICGSPAVMCEEVAG